MKFLALVASFLCLSQANKIVLSTFLYPHALGYCCSHSHLFFIYSFDEVYLIFKAQMDFHSLWTNFPEVFFSSAKVDFTL